MLAPSVSEVFNTRMTSDYRKKIGLALAVIFLNSAITQANAESKISGKFSFGVESDSNVTVSNIDDESGVRDSLWTFSSNVDLKKKVSKHTEAKIGLRHSLDRFQNLSEFDLDTSIVSAEIEHDFDKLTLGTSLKYIVADLDSEQFLSISRASVSASGLLSKKVFFRADYTYSETEFDVSANRDATKHALGANLYYFLEGSKRYVVIGYKYQDEDALAARFDRISHNLKLRYRHRFSAFNRTLIGRLKASYRLRDYDAITPSIGLIREDERYRLGADLKLILSDSLFLMLEYEFSDYQSNLPAADYERSVLGLKLGWQLGH